MNLKLSLGLAAAAASLSMSVAAADVDWGVHSDPSESASPTVVAGSFVDHYFFSIPAGFNLLASVTVSNNLTVVFTPPVVLPPLVVFQINNGYYTLFSDGGSVGVADGGDIPLGNNWMFDGASGSTVNSVSIGTGDYYYKVWGDAVGVSGGLYTITSAIAPIREPGTYAMMLAGLGAVGFVAMRRRQRG